VRAKNIGKYVEYRLFSIEMYIYYVLIKYLVLEYRFYYRIQLVFIILYGFVVFK